MREPPSLRASILKPSSSFRPALAAPSRMERCMAPSHPSSPSIRFTMGSEFGFRKGIDRLASVTSSPFDLCPWARLCVHVPPTKRPRRSTINIPLGIEPMPTVRSAHSRLSPIINIAGLNTTRCANLKRNSCTRLRVPVRNSKDSATLFSSLKSWKSSDRNPACEKMEIAASTSVFASSAIAPIRRRPNA